MRLVEVLVSDTLALEAGVGRSIYLTHGVSAAYLPYCTSRQLPILPTIPK